MHRGVYIKHYFYGNEAARGAVNEMSGELGGSSVAIVCNTFVWCESKMMMVNSLTLLLLNRLRFMFRNFPFIWRKDSAKQKMSLLIKFN